MADRQRRQKELEEKRKKLEEYKKNRPGTKKGDDADSSGTPAVTSPGGGLQSLQQISNLDDLLSNLQDVIPASSPASPSTPSAPVTPPTLPTVASAEQQRRKFRLSVCNRVVSIDIPPSGASAGAARGELQMYSKATQTTSTDFGEEDSGSEPHHNPLTKRGNSSFHAESSLQKTTSSSSSTNTDINDNSSTLYRDVEVDVSQAMEDPQFTSFLEHASKLVEVAIQANIINNNNSNPSSADSTSAVSSTANATASNNIAVQQQEEEEEDEEEDDRGVVRSKRYRVRYDLRLYDDRWCKHRAITDVHWSPKNPDLLLASYCNPSYTAGGVSSVAGGDVYGGVGSGGPGSATPGGAAGGASGADPDGLVLLWSLHNASSTGRPDYRFHYQSAVLCCLFSPYQSTLVIGGTYSGQLVLWDTRVATKNPSLVTTGSGSSSGGVTSSGAPVQHTPLSSMGHTHPVYAMSIVGTKNAHNLVSVSTDGKLCVWSLDNLLQPVEVLELHNKPSKPVAAATAAPVAVTALAFPEQEVNKFFVGTEEGAIYQANRHGTKSGVYERYEGHRGPVTGLEFHPVSGSSDFSNLLISSSTDWSVKLWNQKTSTKPVYSFEDADDYVYDVKWSPVHPAMFATVDGSGSLDIWDLNAETEVPVVKTNVAAAASSANSTSSGAAAAASSPSVVWNRALNKLQWSRDGKRIVTGDSAGALHVMGLGEFATPRSDEWHRFEATLEKLSASSQVGGVDQQSASSASGSLLSSASSPVTPPLNL